MTGDLLLRDLPWDAALLWGTVQAVSLRLYKI